MNPVFSITIYEFCNGYDFTFYDRQCKVLARKRSNVLAKNPTGEWGAWEGDDISLLILDKELGICLHTYEESMVGERAEAAWLKRGLDDRGCKEKWEAEYAIYKEAEKNNEVHYGYRSFCIPNDLLWEVKGNKEPPWKKDPMLFKKRIKPI